MRKIRVLVVDDSTVIRRMLADTLAEDPEIEVVGTAANGKIALAKVSQVNPDIITLDVEMPEMDGIQTLVELRKMNAKIPVIMFSTLTQRGAESTFDALAKGASDYVTKPANVGSVSAAMQNVRGQMVPKIKGLCHWYQQAHTESKVPAPNALRTAATQPAVPRAQKTVSAAVRAVVIGVSTGGPNALASIIPKIPEGFPVPIAIVQHMPPIFTKHLADRLNQISQIDVVEARNGERFVPGKAYIAPGDFHMTIKKSGTTMILSLNQEMPENSCRPAVDVLFRSAAEVYGAGALGVILTGMGQDGMHGAKVIQHCGGTVYAQDEASSVVWGMPGAALRAGVVDSMYALDVFADAIVNRVTEKAISRFNQVVNA